MWILPFGGSPYYDVRGARGSGRTLKESREQATASSFFKYLFILLHFSCFFSLYFSALRICHRSSQPKRFLYVIFDLETTGLSRHDRIVQLAFCLVDNNKKFVSNGKFVKAPSFILTTSSLMQQWEEVLLLFMASPMSFCPITVLSASLLWSDLFMLFFKRSK